MLENTILVELGQALEDPESSLLTPVVLTIDIVLPVALAGLGVFHVRDEGEHHRILALLNVLPYKGKTLIVIGGRAADTRYVQWYLANWGNSLKLLSMVESWMIHGTDHWFLNPSVWSQIPEHRRRRILDAILDESRSIGEESQFSLFDSLRTELIGNAQTLLNRSEDFEGLEELVDTEQRKLQ